MRVLAAQIVNVQGHEAMIGEALEEFTQEVDVKTADQRAAEIDVENETGAPGKVDHHPRKRFIERHIGVTVAAQSFFVADGPGQRLSEGDADVFHRMVRVDVQVAGGFDFQINQAVTDDLVKHVVEKRNAGGKFSLPRAIKIQADPNLCFQCVSADFCLPHGCPCHPSNHRSAHDTILSFRCIRPCEPFMSQFWSQLVHQLTPYVPGEQPKVPDLVKLNTNENPYPPSPRAVAAMQAEIAADGASLRLYPDPNADRLKAAISTCFADYAIRPEQVFVGNGSDEVLAHAFMALLKHDLPILLPDISYSFYPVYCGLYGIDSVSVPLDENFAIRVDDYRQANGGIIIANPNAPTGHLLPLAEIERLAAMHPHSPLVVDEAYIDFAGASIPTAVALVKRYPNLLVIRTLSKSHALAGLRVGYAIGDIALIEALDRVKNSFNSYPLDRLAIVGASAAIEDRAWFEKARHAVMNSRETLVAQLQALGFVVLPSAANFIFARHPQHDAAQLAAGLRQQKVIVRHFKLPRIDQHLRISIGTDAQCQALVDALKTLLPIS